MLHDALASSTESLYSIMSSAAAPVGDHREAVLRRVDAAVDDDRPPEAERLLQRRLELGLALDDHPDAAVGLRELGVVRHLRRQVDVGAAAVEEHVLPLRDHPEVAVVDQHDDDRQVVEDRGRELLGGHLEAAVAVDADDGRLRARGLRADRGGDPVAHRPEAARRDEAPRALAHDVLHRPHLMLADSGRDDHVLAGRERLERLDDLLRLEPLAAGAVAQRELLAPRADLLEPGVGRRCAVSALLRDLGREHADGLSERADDGDVRVAELRDLRGVDVEVDDGRSGGERRQLAR